jgi:hypothetical protein
MTLGDAAALAWAVVLSVLGILLFVTVVLPLALGLIDHDR